MMMKSRQRGAFLMARALLIVGILTAMLVIPVYLKKEREEREAAVHKAEMAHSQGVGGCGPCRQRRAFRRGSRRTGDRSRTDLCGEP
jgi:hypothetical protein